MIKTLTNSVFPNKNPTVETVKASQRHYNRRDRRQGRFVVLTTAGHVILESANPIKFTYTADLEKASVFDWDNAGKVADHCIEKQPKIWLVKKKNGKRVIL